MSHTYTTQDGKTARLKKLHASGSSKFRNHLDKRLTRIKTIYYLCHKRYEFECLIEWDKVKHLYL